MVAPSCSTGRSRDPVHHSGSCAGTLALNRARLPESIEATTAGFQAALEGCGMEVSSWFDTQLDLCMIGIMVTFAWEKALGDEAELRWREHRVADAVARQQFDLPSQVV